MADPTPLLRLVPAGGRPTAAPPSLARGRTGTREPLWRHVLGDRLRRLRHARRETLDETAARAGISPQYLSEMERGVKDPSSEMIAAVAGALDVTLVDLTLAVAEVLGAARSTVVVDLTPHDAPTHLLRSASGPDRAPRALLSAA
jgi:transcriptional regulator with XRE-family HTH domain